MIKTNSELPLCMLHQNIDLNSYDFVLFHLYKENEQYRNYYKSLRKTFTERLMIFDNSAYEFFVKGETLDLTEYYNAIIDLKPDYYILPDVLMDYSKTMSGVKRFLCLCNTDEMKECGSKPLAVAQGNMEIELQSALTDYLNLGIDAVAIPFHNSFFKEMEVDDDIYWDFCEEFGGDNEDARYAMGRVQFMRNNEDLLKRFNHVHLLGSHQPFEKKYYKQWDTMDTGYPVKCALEGVELGKDFEKPNIIIDDFLDKDLDDQTRLLIGSNVLTFKNM
jgi:hypothetical protein